MGVWGSGPTQNDDAFDVFGSVRYVLDHVWQRLRGDDRKLDDRDLELVDAAAGIVNALGEAGMKIRPDDADELSERWQDQLSDDAWDALTAELPSTRPPFDNEGEVERSLREGGAPYDVWMWTAQFGDDRAAAWRASERVAIVVAIARIAGVSDARICVAVAECLLDHFGPQTEEPYLTAAVILADIGSDVSDATVEKMLLEADRALATPGSGPRPIDPRQWLVHAAEMFATGKLKLLLGGISRFERHIPELGALLRPYLHALVLTEPG